MSLWYYLLKGRPHGPVSIEELKKEILAGHLGARDLLYQDRDTKWREAAGYIDLQGHFKVEPVPEGWVLLVRKSDGSGYRQRGPFSDHHIVSLLKNGEISFTDYVWRKGLKEWYKILALPEFHEAFSVKEKSLPPLPTEPVLSDDLSQITMTLPMPKDAEEKVPKEAVPVDEVKKFKEEKKFKVKKDAGPQSEVKKHIVRPVGKRKSRADDSSKLSRRIGIINYYMGLTPVYKTVFVGGLACSVLAALALVTYSSSFIDRKNFTLKIPTLLFVKSSPRQAADKTRDKRANLTQASQPVINKTPESAIAPEPVAEVSAPSVPAAPPVAIEQKVKPTYIKFAKINEGEESARLKIITDASSHYPVYVTFNGAAGDVLEARSLQRKIRISKLEGREIELAKTALPPGEYNLTIESESINTQLHFAFATKIPDFKKKLNRHKKMLSMFHNDERYSFIKTIGRFENETYRLAQNVENAASLNSWASFYRSWRTNFDRIQNPNLKAISSRNRNNYVHAEMWLKLKDLQKKVDQESKALNKAKIRNQGMNPAEIKSAALDLAKLKEQMLQASLWKKD